jgi:hypothetical protein
VAGIEIVAALSGAVTGTLATAFVSQSSQSYTTTIFGDVDDGDN